MSVAIEVVVHDLTEDTTWPDNVAEILSRWTQPLPQTLLSNAVQAALSPGAKEMYLEAMGSSSFIAEDDRSVERTGRPVTDLVDTILSSVRMVKASKAFSDGRQQARRSWTSLLAFLGYAIEEDIYVMTDTTFLKPRTQTKPRIHEIRDIEGLATLLLSCALSRRIRSGPNDDPDGSDDDSSDDSDDDIQAEVISEASMSDGSVSPGNSDDSDDDVQAEVSEESMPDGSVSSGNSETSSSDSGESFVTLDVPPDGHVLSGHGKRVDCLLPVVCVADEKEIEALVTSVVCQRHVWNISVPVVGVSLSNLDTTATVVIGWLCEGEDSTPKVHLLYSHETGSVNHASGRFDLTDPASSLRFSQIILDLQPYFSAIKRSLDPLNTQDFCWRLDLIEFPEKPISWTEREDGLKAWIDGIDGPSVLETPESSLVDPNAPPSTTTMVKGSKPSPAAAGSSSTKHKSTSLIVPSSTKDSGKSTAKSHYSTSDFARLNPGEELFGDNGIAKGTANWLMERRTMLIPRMKILNPSDDYEIQMSDMAGLYDDVTVFCWPKAWKDKDSLPTSDSICRPLFESMFDEFVLYNGQPDKNIRMLPPEDNICKSVSSRISTVLKAVANARVCQKQIGNNKANESQMRFAWDDIMKAMCCPPEEVVSATFYFERSIYLPTNTAATLGKNFEREAAKQADLHLDIIRAQATSAKKLHVNKDIYVDLVHMNNRAGITFTTIQEKGYSVTEAERANEPSDAIVDGIYCFEHVLKKPQPIRKPRTTPTSETRQWTTSLMKLFQIDSTETTGKSECKRTQAVVDDDFDDSTAPSKNPHARCFMCPAVTESSSDASSPVVAADDATQISFPIIVTKYKRKSEMIHQAFHQVEMYCVACVEHYASLGITDFPVWGIVTAGVRGSILMAWKSSKSIPRTTGTTGEANRREQNSLQFRDYEESQVLRPHEASRGLSFRYICSRNLSAAGESQSDLVNLPSSVFTTEPTEDWKMKETEKPEVPKLSIPSPLVSTEPENRPVESPLEQPVPPIPQVNDSKSGKSGKGHK